MDCFDLSDVRKPFRHARVLMRKLHFHTRENLEMIEETRIYLEDALHTTMLLMEIRIGQSPSASHIHGNRGCGYKEEVMRRMTEVKGGQEGQEEESTSQQRKAVQHVEPQGKIKKKSFSQSSRAAAQSSHLICFQEPFCSLLSCCASNREAAEGALTPPAPR